MKKSLTKILARMAKDGDVESLAEMITELMADPDPVPAEPALPAAPDDAPAAPEQPEDEDLSIKKITGEMIVRALEKHAGNRKLAARELGISERTLYRKLPAEYRSDNKAKR